jgi:hypothetical protein
VCDLEKTDLVSEEGQGPLGGYRAKRKENIYGNKRKNVAEVLDVAAFS